MLENDMDQFYSVLKTTLLFLVVAVAAGCAAEVGSEKWCAELKEKPKGDWTANELADFTKHCIF